MNRKEKIAMEFVSLHKDTDWENWVDVNKLEDIYYNIVGGLYGGDFDMANNYQIEIDRFESKSGKPIQFKVSGLWIGVISEPDYDDCDEDEEVMSDADIFFEKVKHLINPKTPSEHLELKIILKELGVTLIEEQ